MPSVSGSLESEDAVPAVLAEEALRPASGGRDSASRGSCGSNENASRDTSGFLLILSGSRHFDLADLKLPVEVRKLPSGVFQQEFPLEEQNRAEYVEEQNRCRSENHGAVGMEYDTFVRRHELQLVHQPEPVSEQESDGQQQGVGNHGWPTLAKHSDSVLANPVLPKERAGVRSNRGSPDACRLCEGAKDGGMGCAEMEEGDHEGEKEGARGGWAEVARRTPATALASVFC